MLFTVELGDVEVQSARVAFASRGAQQQMLAILDPAEAALAGEFDGCTPRDLHAETALARDAASGLVAIWERTWKTTARGDPLLGGNRRKSLSTALKAGYRVSDVARAIIGMSLDEWEGRGTHRGWEYVVRSIDKWIDLYEHGRSGPSTRKVRARCGREIVVPAGYSWSEQDEHAASSGWRFDLQAEKWTIDG